MSKTIVVTGASSGFGRQVSQQLSRRGNRVYATLRDIEQKNARIAAEMQKLAVAKNFDLRVLELDVTSTESVNKAADRVLAESGAPDVVINNAGQMFVGITAAFTAEEYTEQLDVNTIGVHRVIRAFLPAMRKRASGLFINLSSTAGRAAAPFNSLYHASKWALEGYSLALRRELAACGIDIVLLEPGPFATSLFPASRQPEDKEGRAATYPEAVHASYKQVGAMFEEIFNDPETPTDPQLVVNRMIELVEMEPGTRPFRSVVGVDFGVRALNAAVEPHEEALAQAAGWGPLAPSR